MTSLRQREERLLTLGQVDDVPGGGELAGDLLGGLDPPELDETLAGLSEGLGHEVGGHGVALGGDDRGLLLLLGLLDQEARLLGFLLGDLTREKY